MSPTGLHFEDINILLGVLQKLVDKGNTVINNDNLDVIKVADYIIDMGPGGGKNGEERSFVPEPRKRLRLTRIRLPLLS